MANISIKTLILTGLSLFIVLGCSRINKTEFIPKNEVPAFRAFFNANAMIDGKETEILIDSNRRIERSKISHVLESSSEMPEPAYNVKVSTENNQSKYDILVELPLANGESKKIGFGLIFEGDIND